MIKAVFFDVDGTLYPIKKQNMMFVKLFLLHPIKTFKFKKARKKIRIIFKNKSGSYITRKDFLKAQAKTVNKDENYFDDIYEYMTDHYKINTRDYVVPLLDYLKKNGYILGVLSDFPLLNKLKTLKIENYFDYKLSAEDIGFLKPHKNAFQYILDKTNLKSEEVLYIGDDKVKDKDGASLFGMYSYLVNESANVTSVRKDIDNIINVASRSTNNL